MEETIGGYKIIEKLGKGGFGTVYKAEAEDKSIVALKLLHGDMSEDDRILTKFLDEATILARIDHKHITKFIRLIKSGDDFAILMEFIEGITLSALMKKHNGLIPFEMSMKIAKQMLDAFFFANNKGIIHRDIKPANIMIDKNEDVKIMDFGIARVSSTPTQGTSFWGTPHYSAPERFSGGLIDQRTDIYSIGIVLYEIFTGKRPFETADTARIIYCHVNEPPDPPRKHVKGLPDPVNAAIMKSLEKDPGKRFNDCAEFAQALFAGHEFEDEVTRLAVGVTPSASRPYIPQPAKKNRTPLLVIGSVVILLGVLFAALYQFDLAKKIPFLNKDAKLFVQEYKKAKEYYDTGRFMLALEHVQKALQYDETNNDAVQLLSSIYYNRAVELEQNKQHDEALDYATLSLQYSQNNLDARKLIEKIYYKKAEFFYNNSQEGDALKSAEKVLEYNQNNIETLVLIGAVYFEKGNREKSLEYLNRAQGIDPANKTVQQWIQIIKE